MMYVFLMKRPHCQCRANQRTSFLLFLIVLIYDAKEAKGFTLYLNLNIYSSGHK